MVWPINEEGTELNQFKVAEVQFLVPDIVLLSQQGGLWIPKLQRVYKSSCFSKVRIVFES
jgi:hypothetical protein